MKADSSVRVQSPVLGEMIAIHLLRPSTANPRKNFNADRLQELADSIKVQGIIEPLIVRPRSKRIAGEKELEDIGLLKPAKIDHYEIVAGARRYCAAKLAKLDQVPCIVRALADKDVAEIRLIENLQREDLSEMEEARGYAAAIAVHHYTPDALAEKISKSKNYVYAMLKLCSLPQEAAKALESGAISKSVAEIIARMPNEKLRDGFAKAVLEGEQHWDQDKMKMVGAPMSLRAAKHLQTSKFMLELKGAPFNREDITLVPEAGPCSKCPKMTGNDRAFFPGGRGDLCTDPLCFNAKRLAAGKAVKEIAAIKGIDLVPKGKVSFDHWSGRMQSVDYVDLAEQCPYDTKKNRRSYKQLLVGSDVTISGAIDKKNHLHRLAPRVEVEKILEKKHKIKLPMPGQARDYQAEMRKEKEEQDTRRKTTEKVLRVIDGMKWTLTREILLLIVDDVCANIQGNVQGKRISTRGCKTEADLVKVALTAIAADGLRRWAGNWYDSDGSKVRADQVCKLANVDLKALLASVRKESKVKSQGESETWSENFIVDVSCRDHRDHNI